MGDKQPKLSPEMQRILEAAQSASLQKEEQARTEKTVYRAGWFASLQSGGRDTTPPSCLCTVESIAADGLKGFLLKIPFSMILLMNPSLFAAH